MRLIICFGLVSLTARPSPESSRRRAPKRTQTVRRSAAVHFMAPRDPRAAGRREAEAARGAHAGQKGGARCCSEASARERLVRVHHAKVGISASHPHCCSAVFTPAGATICCRFVPGARIIYCSASKQFLLVLGILTPLTRLSAASCARCVGLSRRIAETADKRGISPRMFPTVLSSFRRMLLAGACACFKPAMEAAPAWLNLPPMHEARLPAWLTRGCVAAGADASEEGPGDAAEEIPELAPQEVEEFARSILPLFVQYASKAFASEARGGNSGGWPCLDQPSRSIKKNFGVSLRDC